MTVVPPDAFCACCVPGTPPAPALIFNRPGLRTIAWRTGSYATYREAMIEALTFGPPSPEGEDGILWRTQTRSALGSLTSRDDAEYAILLIDLFAAVSDVLAFYSERYVNEIFVRTANERDSVLRLVRLIGYRLAPGVAATASLAFTLDPKASARIRAGLKVMSVPGQNETPQTFETIGQIVADGRLNAVPLFGQPQPVPPFAAGQTRFPILTWPNPLSTGATVAIVGGDQMQLGEVRALETAADGAYLSLARAIEVPGAATVGFKVKRDLSFFGHNVPDSYNFYDANPAIPAALRWKTRVVGVDFAVSFPANQSRYPLDRKVEDLAPGALVLVDRGAGVVGRFAFAIVTAIEHDKAVLAQLADTVTWMHLQPVAMLVGADGYALLPGAGLPAISDRRRSRILELERPAIVPRGYVYPPTLSGSAAYLRGDHLDDFGLLVRKQRIVIVDGAERRLATIGAVTILAAGADGVAHAQIGFDPPLDVALASPSLNGNVAPASHGETQRDEPLGHGDASKLFQRFKLQRKPLTRLATGAAIAPRAELAVRVNGELWDEAPSLFGRGPSERIYTLRDDDEGASTISFGDGRTGARAPSGASNVVAHYRIGMGLGGRLKADQLSTLLERPVGVRAVTNPLATDGGVDPEPLAAARQMAPTTVRTFGRAISLEDFEDIAHQTGVVAGARVTWVWVGLEQTIQLTVAGPDGQRLSSDGMRRLHEALDSARDPNHPLILGNLWRVPIVVAARLMRDPRFESDAVGAAAQKVLLDFLSFVRQPFGRALHLSQVVAALQSASGVSAVDVDLFQIKGFSSWTAAQLARRGATAAPVQPHIRVFDARARPPAARLDPLALAGLALDPDAVALPAEQAFIQAPAADLSLTVVEAL